MPERVDRNDELPGEYCQSQKQLPLEEQERKDDGDSGLIYPDIMAAPVQE